MQPKLGSSHRLLIVAALLVGSVIGSPAFAEKLPIPDTAAQEAASKLVIDVYKDDITKAKKPEDKSALAQKLLDLGGTAKNDPAGRFVLLVMARDLAADAGDSITSLAVVNAIADAYDSDGLTMKYETLARINKSIKQPQRKELIDKIDAVVDDAMAVDRYGLAEQAVTLELQVARQVGDSKLTGQAVGSVKKVQELKTAYDKVKTALDVLDKQPVDPDANLAVGKFECFVKSNWDKGLPMLALGSDAELKALAETEIKGLANSDAQAALGDGWWKQSEKANGSAKKQMQLRAGKWYQEAVPGLTGLAKAKVEKRLKEVEPAKSASSEKAEGRDSATGSFKPIRIDKMFTFTDEKTIMKDWEINTNKQWSMDNGNLRIGGEYSNDEIRLKNRLLGDMKLIFAYKVTYRGWGCKHNVTLWGETLECGRGVDKVVTEVRKVVTVERKGGTIIFTNGKDSPRTIVMKEDQLNASTSVIFTFNDVVTVIEGIKITGTVVPEEPPPATK